MTNQTDLIRDAVALLRSANRNLRANETPALCNDIDAFLAKIDAAEGEATLPDDVLIWDVDNCEEGPFTSEHDYLIAMTELSGEEDLIGMSFRCTMATALPSKELTITAVCPVTGNPSEWTETILAASARNGGAR